MPPRAMPSRARPASHDLSPEDFDSIRDAVMETARGRWFLDEYAARLRTAENAELIDSLHRLENAVASNHDALMARLADALAPDGYDDAATEDLLGADSGTEHLLAPRHMKFYRADEDIFEPAPYATIAAVPDPVRAVMDQEPAASIKPPKQRIIINRQKPGEQIEVPLMTEDYAKAS